MTRQTFYHLVKDELTFKGFKFFFIIGYAHLIYGTADTQLKLSDIQGDQTATIYVTDKQVLRAAVVEGVSGSFITNINIIVDELAVLHVPQTLIIDGVTLDIKGTCTFYDLVVESGAKVIGHTTTFTSEFADGKYRNTSHLGSYSLGSIKLKAGSKFVPTGGLKLRVGTLEMKRFVVMETYFVDIQAANILLEREASLSTIGTASDLDAPGTAKGTGKNGGAHASSGGVGANSNVDDASTPYGTIYEPLTFGGSGGEGGAGGGYIDIATDELLLDGLLQASGANSTTGGGGAGGSVFVKCDVLKGLGSMESKGGNVQASNAGAGSGGHIAVSMKEDGFKGKYSAAGGSSPAAHGSGGPGSVYTLSSNNGEKLICDNENGQTDYYTTLDETKVDLTFDAVDLYNFAKLQIIKDGQDRTLKINKVNGDGTGLIRMQTNQTGTLERTADTLVKSKLEINLELHKNGQFILSETTTVLGLAEIALDLDGIMRGVINLHLGPSRKMRIGRSAKIVPYTPTELSKQTDVTFGLLQLEPGSFIEYDPDTGANMMASQVNLKFDAQFYADYLNITVTNLDIELESEMSCSSKIRPNSDTMDITLGSGVPGNGYGGGAGHSGKGGGEFDANYNPIPGEAYNSLYKPMYAGSRGSYNKVTGAKSGGKGGGWIRMRIGDQFMNDGTLSVDGESASATGGGGSGGSIWIDVGNFEGYGTVSASGGDGRGSNGAGSAGRIAFYCNQKIMFEGTYSAFGGSGTSAMQSSAAGTVYLQDIRGGRKYEQLLLDNRNGAYEKYAEVNESKAYLYFDEVHVMNQASIHITDNQNVTFDISRLYSDGTGLFHIHKDQILKAEYKPYMRHAFLTGINFISDTMSEIYFSSIVYIYGNGVKLKDHTETSSLATHGRLTGISDLILGYESLVYLGDNAHTASVHLSNGSYHVIDDGGTVTFGTVDLRSYSSIKYAPDQIVVQKVGQIDVRYQSVISAESVKIEAGVFNLEAGSSLTASALERPTDTLDHTEGQGRDASGTITVGTGAGHATDGGGTFFFACLLLFYHTIKTFLATLFKKPFENFCEKRRK